LKALLKIRNYFTLRGVCFSLKIPLGAKSYNTVGIKKELFFSFSLTLNRASTVRTDELLDYYLYFFVFF